METSSVGAPPPNTSTLLQKKNVTRMRQSHREVVMIDSTSKEEENEKSERRWGEMERKQNKTKYLSVALSHPCTQGNLLIQPAALLSHIVWTVPSYSISPVCFGGLTLVSAEPVWSENEAKNEDPRSPFSYEIGDPGPQFPNILRTLGSPISYHIIGTLQWNWGAPFFFFFVLLHFAITMQ